MVQPPWLIALERYGCDTSDPEVRLQVLLFRCVRVCVCVRACVCVRMVQWFVQSISN